MVSGAPGPCHTDELTGFEAGGNTLIADPPPPIRLRRGTNMRNWVVTSGMAPLLDRSLNALLIATL
jgi:hypothetical protein